MNGMNERETRRGRRRERFIGANKKAKATAREKKTEEYKMGESE